MSAKYLKRYEAVFLVLHAKRPKLTYAQASKMLRNLYLAGLQHLLLFYIVSLTSQQMTLTF